MKDAQKENRKKLHNKLMTSSEDIHNIRFDLFNNKRLRVQFLFPISRIWNFLLTSVCFVLKHMLKAVRIEELFGGRDEQYKMFVYSIFLSFHPTLENTRNMNFLRRIHLPVDKSHSQTNKNEFEISSLYF